MATPKISATIITLNEESNLPRALESVKWADEIIVVDSGSTDRTHEIAKDFGARVITRTWNGYGHQKNTAQDFATHDWVLNIDADEEVPEDLAREIKEKVQTTSFQGFLIPRKTFYLGRWIRHGGWYPNYLGRLARKDVSRWTEPKVHEKLKIEGKIGRLQNPIRHYTFKSIEDQIQTNLRYAQFGAHELRQKGVRPSLLKLLFKPVGKFLETYVLKRGFLDGLAGLIISINAAHSIFLKYAYLFEEKLRENSRHRQ